MGLQQKSQAIQSGAQQLRVGANQAQAADQTMQERAKITQMMSSGQDDTGASIRDAQGNPDPAKILPALGRMAPLTGQKVAQDILTTHTAKVGFENGALALNGNQRASVMGPLQAVGLAPADPQGIKDAGDALDQLAGVPGMANVAGYGKTLLTHLTNAQKAAEIAAKSEKTPEGRAKAYEPVTKMANMAAAMLQGGQQVGTQPTGSDKDNGRTIQSGTTAPPVAGGGFTASSSIRRDIAPGAEDQIESDSEGRRYIVSRSPSGAIVGTRPVPGTQGTGGTGSGPVNLPVNVTPGQRDAVSKEANDQSTQASQAGGLHGINQQIYDLAGKPDTTNKWGEIGSKLRRTIGGDALPGDNNAEDYDSMTKLLAQANMRTAQAMGVHTDAGSAQVTAAGGSQHYAPGALKHVVSVNDGMIKAQEMYAAGLNKTISTQGYGGVNDFKTSWGKTFDLDAAQYMAAHDSGSATRLAEVKSALHINRDDAKTYSPLAEDSIKKKIKAMHDLSGSP